MKDDMFIKSVLDILNTTERVMPAHFTSNGNRTQTFLINYSIPSDIEYDMASQAWSMCPNPNLLLTGEDPMLASYITTKERKETLLSALIEIIKQNSSNTDESQEYYNSCIEFGKKSGIKK